MRLRAAVVACLLLAGPVACGTEQAGPPVDEQAGAPTFGATATPGTTAPDPSTPPPVSVHLAGGDLDVVPFTYCWSGTCADGAMATPTDVGSGDSLDLGFPVAGWSFQADFAPAGADGSPAGTCQRSRVATLTPDADGAFTLTPLGPAGSYVVHLSGSGPQGDWAGLIGWTTTVDGPEPPPTATTSIVWDPHGKVDGGHGFTLDLAGLERTPNTATATVTATSADGASTTFDAGPAELGCPASGSVHWSETGDAHSQAVAALGPAPFTYAVTVVLDGVEHHATATWPDDHTDDPFDDDPAPVPLELDPGL